MKNITEFLAQCMANHHITNGLWESSKITNIADWVKNAEKEVEGLPVEAQNICNDLASAYQYRAYTQGIKAGIALVIEAIHS